MAVMLGGRVGRSEPVQHFCSVAKTSDSHPGQGTETFSVTAFHSLNMLYHVAVF